MFASAARVAGRGAVRRCTAMAPPAAVRRMSSLEEATVKVTFINIAGERKTVRGFPGQSVLEVAKQNKIDIDGMCRGGGDHSKVRRSENWEEHQYGFGPACYDCHVLIPRDWSDKVGKAGQVETDIMKVYLDELYSPRASRLCCQIEVTKDLDGLTVFVPDNPPSMAGSA